MSMIDTHAHLTSPEFQDDLSSVLDRAKVASISAIICVSESLSDANQVLAICNSHRDVLHPAIGMHPEHATTLSDAALSRELREMTALISSELQVRTIGEIGLDYTPRVLAIAPSAEIGKERQRRAFSHFISLSQTNGLPMTIHSRGAGHYALRMITDAARNAARPLCATMHAYDGRAIHAERALDTMKEGLYFSIPPCIVRSDNLIKTVRRLPLERLVLESDSPALAAVAGERNEPAEIARSLRMIAALKGVSEAHAKEVLFQNTLRVFPTLRSTADGK